MERNQTLITIQPSAQIDQGTCINAAGAVCGSGEPVYAIVRQSNTADVEPVECFTSGEGYALAGAAVAVGDLLKSDANGRLVPATTGTDAWFAIALEAASAGELFTVLKI